MILQLPEAFRCRSDPPYRLALFLVSFCLGVLYFNASTPVDHGGHISYRSSTQAKLDASVGRDDVAADSVEGAASLGPPTRIATSSSSEKVHKAPPSSSLSDPVATPRMHRTKQDDEQPVDTSHPSRAYAEGADIGEVVSTSGASSIPTAGAGLTTCTNVKRMQRASVEDFVDATHRCTDKSTLHLYEYAYGSNFARWKYQRLQLSNGSSHSRGTLTTPHVSPLRNSSAGTTSRRSRRWVSDLDALSPAQRQNAAVTSFTAPNAIKIFEIGLGCTMKCAAGGFQLLRKYWKGQVHYVGMEYDFDTCVKMWNISDIYPPDTKWLEHYVCRGDQGNLSTLHACLEKHGPFDVIIDDGSHLAIHMVTNFEYLFPKDKYLKPGGIYFLEDLPTQFVPWYAAYPMKKRWQYPNGHEMVQDMMSWKLCYDATAQDVSKIQPREQSSADRLISATIPPIVPRHLQVARSVHARQGCPYLRYPYPGWRETWDRLGDVACDNEICVFQKQFIPK